MKKLLRRLLIPLQIISLIFFLTSCKKTQNSSLKFKESSQKSHIIYNDLEGLTPDEISNDVIISQTKYDRLTNKIIANEIRRYYSKKFTAADSVTIIAYDENQKLNYQIICDSAYIDESAQLFTAMGHVTVTNKEGILKTSILDWDQKTDNIFAPKDVVIIKNKNFLHGKELTTNLNFDFINIKRVSAKGNITNEKI